MYLRGVSKANQEYFIDVEIGHADKFAGLTMRSMSNDPSATTRWKSVSAMDKIAKYLRDNFEPHIDPSDPNNIMFHKVQTAYLMRITTPRIKAAPSIYRRLPPIQVLNKVSFSLHWIPFQDHVI